MAVDGVRVIGLADFRRELRRMSATLPRELRSANLSAAKLVADEARPRAQAQGGVARKTAPSIKALAQQRGAAVRIGGVRYPFALGAEFGSKGYRQFKPWRGNQWSPDQGSVGYFLHPAVRDTRRRVIDLYGDLIERLAARAFPKGA
jgi:hypothetical protein